MNMNIYNTDQTEQASNQSGWQSPQLTPLGLYYPLGPCQAHVPVDQLERILHALPNLFQKLSLATKYEESPISVTCRSLDQVEFVVTLFQTANEQKQSIVILEIQHTEGDMNIFHRYSQQILEVSASGLPEDDNDLDSTSSCNNSIESTNSSCSSYADAILPNKATTTQGISAALEMAWDMMSTDRYDAQILGLESIVHMTNPMNGWPTAEKTAHMLLQNQETTFDNITKSILYLACCNDLHMQKDNELAYLAMIAFSQLLRVATESSTINMEHFFLRCNCSANHVVESILKTVNGAQHNPHNAYYAIKCLTDLCHSVPQLRMYINSSDVQRAQHCGDCMHLALAEASYELLVALQA